MDADQVIVRFALTLVWILAGEVWAGEPLVYSAPKASAPVKIDGVLDDGVWQKSMWTSDFVDIEGDGRPRPRYRTRAKMAWDDEYFYVAAELEDPHVWATLTKHDSVIFQNNDFEVFIDPDGDTLNYSEFEMNALNTTWDLFLDKPYRHGGKARNEYEITGLHSAVQVRSTINNPKDRDQGWTLEIAFPWKSIAPRKGEWRVNFSRVQWWHFVREGKYTKVPGLKEDNWVWSSQGVINMHVPEHWGHVRFVDAK